VGGQITSIGAVCIKLAFLQESSQRKHGIESAGRMTLAQNKPVPTFIAGRFRVNSQDLEVESHKDIDAGKRRTYV